MKKIFLLLLAALFTGALACSKKESFAEIPTPGPSTSAAVTPLETPSPEPLEYVIEDLKGTVLIKESGSTQAEPAEEEETVEPGDEIITKAGAEASLTLDENTMFHLSENSDVKVAQLDPNPSRGFISRLSLLGGKVLSEVEKLGDSHSTFEVESGGVICGVRGTAFEVEKQGQAVHASTFHGIVEMRKGDLVQPVSGGQHSAFFFKRGSFLPPRALKSQENRHYQNWLGKKRAIQQKQSDRMAAIRSLSSLPPEKRNQILENLRNAKPRERMRMMRQSLQAGALPLQPGIKRGLKNKPLAENKPWNGQRQGMGPGQKRKNPGQNFRLLQSHNQGPKGKLNNQDLRKKRGLSRPGQGGKPRQGMNPNQAQHQKSQALFQPPKRSQSQVQKPGIRPKPRPFQPSRNNKNKKNQPKERDKKEAK